MSAHIIDGKQIASQIREELKQQGEELFQRFGRRPGLATVLIGDDPASRVYVNSKRKACDEVGFLSRVIELPAETQLDEVLSLLQELNQDERIDGILVQLPLPPQLREEVIISAIIPEKDVDGFHPVSLGRLIRGVPGFVPCTPLGIQELLRRSQIQTRGKHLVVVGRSNIVGKPFALLMMQKQEGANATVTVCHSASENLAELTRSADILVAAIGKPQFIKADMIKPGAVVIDVGVNRVDAPERPRGYRLVGDVEFERAVEVASAITPVPGGVGPMTIAMLLRNTLKSAEQFLMGEG